MKGRPGGPTLSVAWTPSAEKIAVLREGEQTRGREMRVGHKNREKEKI